MSSEWERRMAEMEDGQCISVGGLLSAKDDRAELYDKLIVAIREIARAAGYAIGVHGSLKRDLDLIACPWTSEAIGAIELAARVRLVTEQVAVYAQLHPSSRPCEMNGHNDHFERGMPGYKRHGRLVWAYHLVTTHDGPYVDLSIMPRLADD